MSVTLDEQVEARRALEFYETVLKPVLEPDHIGEEVAVFLETGDYEVAPTIEEADRRLRARHPEAVFVVMQVGRPAMPLPWTRDYVDPRKP